MAIELRNTGISVFGDVPWGTHFCNFYETKQDLLDTLVPYFKAGLENKEFCVWVASNFELVTVAEAKGALAQAVPDLERHLADGDIEILNGLDWYLAENVFNLESVTSAWDAKLKRALDRGYEGMRVSGDTLWPTEKDWKDFGAYEKQLDDLIADRPMTVLCTCPLARSGAGEVLDVVRAHEFATARRQGKWEVIETPELMHAKAEIKRLNEELEQKVSDRTRQLAVANQELRKEIGERKRAENRLRLVIDTIPAMVFTALPDGSVDFVNQRWLQYLGLSLEDVQGWGWDSTIHPEDRARSMDHWRSTVAARQSAENELRVRRADGVYRWILGCFVPLEDESGEIVKWYGVSTDIDDRKRAEALLHAREQEFRAIVENAPDQIARYDREFRRTYANPALAKSCDLPAEGLIGKPMFSIIRDAGLDVKEERLAQIRQRLAAVFETGKSYEFEVTLPMPPGRRDYNVRLFPELDLNGSVINVLSIARDITDRKQTEDALRRSEDHLRLVIDTIPIMVWSLRPDGVVDFLNQRWINYTGLSLEQYIKDPTGPIHPADVPRVMERWRAEMEVGEAYEEEMRLRRTDGEYHWFLVRTAPLHDEQGNLVKWYGVSIDIEDRKRAEEKLRQSERQLIEAQRLAHVGGWDWDLSSNEVTWSDELYRIFGLPLGAIKVRGDAMPFIHPEDRDLVLSTVKRAISNQEPYSFYYRVLRADGTERIVQSRGSVLSDEHGEPIRVFGASQDVTEFKRAEEKLKATSEQLRALSASVQSAREAEAARISREIHDELGSALTSLKLDLELIRRRDFPSTNDADLARFQEKIKTMMQLIDQTVDIVRKISAELRPSVLDDIGLVAAIRWQAQQFEAQAGIVCHYDFSVEDIALDPQQATAVFRVFQEALTNVVRHAEATRVDITLDKENDDLVLTIRDNGRGITADEKADRRSLGLLGMQERVNLIGGSIHVTGVKGQGTVIMVRVPVQGKG